MKFCNEFIKTTFLFIFVILIFIIGVPFVVSIFNVSVLFMVLQNLFDDISAPRRILENSFEIGALILLVGIPAIVINYLSKIFPIKYNFIILPIISFPLVFLLAIIHAINFEDTSDMKGLAMALYIGTSIIFLIIFSLVISFIRLRRENVK